MGQEVQKVLVVDDNQDVRELIVHILNADGFHVYAAVDGENALAILNSNKVDLVLLDVMMPGKSGLEVLSEIRSGSNKALRDIPVVMITAKSSTEDIDAALAIGASSYIVKPFRGEAVLVHGEPVTEHGPDRGFVFQDYANFPHRTVLDNVALAVQAALLQQSAPGAVFGAFCDSRLGGDWGYSFGTLGSGVDFEAIIRRAWAPCDVHRPNLTRIRPITSACVRRTPSSVSISASTSRHCATDSSEAGSASRSSISPASMSCSASGRARRRSITASMRVVMTPA